MTHPPSQAPANAGPRGLIDTIQAGFNIVNRHLWLLLLPLLVDLFLWLGPQFTIGSALTDSVAAHTSGGVTDAFDRFATQAEPGAGGILSAIDALGRTNLLWLLAVPILGLPSYRAGLPGAGSVIPLDSMVSVLLAGLAVVLVGFSLAVVFYGLLAQIIRSGQAAASELAADFGVLILRSIGMVGLGLGAFTILGVPIALLVAGTLDSLPVVSLLLASLVLGVGIWMFVHLFLAPDALFVSLVGPVVAIRRSVTIVRHFFWESVLFVGLIVVITRGFALILPEVARNLQVTGMVLAIVGHIYISAAVSASTMTYYRDRLERLQLTPRGSFLG